MLFNARRCFARKPRYPPSKPPLPEPPFLLRPEKPVDLSAASANAAKKNVSNNNNNNNNGFVASDSENEHDEEDELLMTLRPAGPPLPALTPESEIRALLDPDYALEIKQPGKGRIRSLHERLVVCKEKGLGERAESLLKELKELEGYTYFNLGVVAGAWSNALNAEKVRQVLKVAEKNGRLDVPMYTDLIRVHYKLKRPAEAWQVFDHYRTFEHLQPDEVVYSLMISVCALERKVERAFLFFEEMVTSGLVATDATYDALIMCCASRRDWYEATFQTVAKMKAAGYAPTFWTYNNMLLAASNAGDIQGVKRILTRAEESGIALTPKYLTYLMNAYARNTQKARPEEIKALIIAADDLWAEMHNHPDWQPDAIIFNGYLKVFTNCLRVKRAELIFAAFETSGVQPNPSTYSFMLDMYMRHRKTIEAEDLYRRMLALGSRPTARIYQIMINGFTRANYFRSALRFLHELVKDSSVRVNPTHTLLLAQKTADFPHIRTVLTLLLKEKNIAGLEAEPFFKRQIRPTSLFTKQKGAEAGAIKYSLETEGRRLGMGIEDTNLAEPEVYRWHRRNTGKPADKRHGTKPKSFKR